MNFFSFRFYIVIALSFMTLVAQDPAAREDAETERRKLLRASDLVDSLQLSHEQLQTEVSNLQSKIKTSQDQIDALQGDNLKLKNDLITLKTAIEKSEQARIKERELLLKEIGAVVSEKTKSYPQSHNDALLKVRDDEATPHKPTEKNDKPEKPEKNDPPVKEKGFYHIVEKGHTLSGIADAFRQQGVNVTIDEIRAANNLSKTDVIHVGQKLFIPKK